MAISTNFKIASRVGQMARSDNLTSSGTLAPGAGGAATFIDSAGLLPMTGNSAGDTVMTNAGIGLDSAREYIFNGAGWYQVEFLKNTWTMTSVSITQCFDHYGTWSWTASTGLFKVQSRAPDATIHTARTDCGSNPQGNITYFNFFTERPNSTQYKLYNNNGFRYFTGSIVYSGRDGSGTHNITNLDLSQDYQSGTIGFTDGSGGASGYSITLSGTFRREY